MGVERILINGVTEILKKLVPVVAQEISLAWGVKDDLKSLQDTLEMILLVIADAETKQPNDAAVGLWLRRLKDVAYDADDVMNEFSYETTRQSLRGNSFKYKASDFVSSANPLAFRFRMARKIKQINQRLDGITKDMSRFQLQTTPVPPGESSEQQSRQTASSINESDIIGREDDKKRIIDLLTKVIPSSTSSDSKPEKVSVVSIMGMGGLGKTTLAQLVYKDELLDKHFELKMWVHVSEYFDVGKILTKIMESSTRKKFDTPSSFDVLESKVQEQLNDKRYLLVLDDLWNDKGDQWERLYAPLIVGAQGSKILITTRKSQVADVVKGSIPPYKLEKLEDDECWYIIEKRAFSPGRAVKTTNMTRIGRDIAKKCSGIPLAAKFLGGLMRSRNEEVNWLSILQNDNWNKADSQSTIIPVLRLSYDNLSSQLKQCFSYCCIFPKGWEINRVTLVQLWIAEGFLDTCNVGNGKLIEDIADEYFQSLVWSSFLDVEQKSLLNDIRTCRMHDLVHDLAQAVVGDHELASLKVSDLHDIPKIRRLQLILADDLDSSSTLLKSLSSVKKLRTLFIPGGSSLDPSVFSEINHLHILHVGRVPNPYPKPKWRSLSVKLKYLRYLHLTCLDLREVENDQSINKLYNLETLVINNVGGVQIQILLSNIQSSQKLRYLEVSWTDMVELPDSVTSLCNLQTLDLNNCELVVVPDSISGLKNLRFLNLSFNPVEELPVSVVTLSNLETLDASSCKNLKALPESVSGLARLRIFDFKNCPLLEELPDDFGALTQLRYLNLEDTQIKVLPESCANLNNIEYVNLFHCEIPNYVKNWTKLRRFYYLQLSNPISCVGNLVCLEILIYSVPEKLKNEPEGINELGNLNFLVELGIINLQNVKDPIDAERSILRGKYNLRDLYLHWGEMVEESGMMSWDQKSCNHLQVFEALQPPSGLRTLCIHNFMGRDLPTWMCVPSGLPNLVWLKFDNCKGIKQLSAIGHLQRLRTLILEGMSLKSLDIVGFPSLIQLKLTDMFHLEELCCSYPSCLQEMWIRGCKSLKEISTFTSVTYLELEKVDHKLVCSVVSRQASLTQLYLKNIDGLVYFPISILQNNCNLQLLQVKECNQFQGFQRNNHEKNNKVTLIGPDICSGSLQKLDFLDCPVFKIFPDLRGWTSLQKLLIWKCPQVRESFTYDLKSISSLKKLYVDFIQRDEQRGDPSDVEELINLMHM